METRSGAAFRSRSTGSAGKSSEGQSGRRELQGKRKPTLHFALQRFGGAGSCARSTAHARIALQRDRIRAEIFNTRIGRRDFVHETGVCGHYKRAGLGERVK